MHAEGDKETRVAPVEPSLRSSGLFFSYFEPKAIRQNTLLKQIITIISQVIPSNNLTITTKEKFSHLFSTTFHVAHNFHNGGPSLMKGPCECLQGNGHKEIGQLLEANIFQ